MNRHDRNYTAFKVFVDNYGSLTGNILDRLLNDSHKLRRDRAAMREAVSMWCEDNSCLRNAGYKIRFDKRCGCNCGCSPGFRVIVNEKDVRNSGYTQLLWLKRGSGGPSSKWLDMSGKETE